MTRQRALRIILPTVSLAAAFITLPVISQAQYGNPQDSAYGQQSGYPAQDGYAQGGYGQDNSYPDNGYQNVQQAPPAIPEYDQPEAPSDGYLWTPGYWAYGPQGYYWVQGSWVEPPYTGALWTPGWWGYNDSAYFWNAGYWGPTVGYYGGINYGFGYFGTGFYGGYWGGGRFYYNRAYSRFGYGFRGNVYNRPYNGYNGRPGGPAFNGHPPIQYIGRNNNGGRSSFYHGSTINGGFRNQAGGNGGRGFENRGTENRGFENRGAQNRTFENRSVENRGYTQQQGFAGNRNEVSRAPQANTYNSAPRQDFGGSRYGSPATAPRSSEGGSQNYNRGYSAPAQQQNYSRSYSAPTQQSSPRNFSMPSQQSAPRSSSTPGGGGNFGGGGGGGFRGGGAPAGGGGGGSHGGGGGRH